MREIVPRVGDLFGGESLPPMPLADLCAESESIRASVSFSASQENHARSAPCHAKAAAMNTIQESVHVGARTIGRVS